MSTSRIGSALVATLGIGIAVVVGYQLHQANKKRMEARAVVTVVTDTTSQIRTAFKTASPQALATVEGNLRVTKTWSNQELADATEQYLVGAREILRRRADAAQLAEKAAADRAALTAHMTRAGARDATWIRTASALKRQVERDHFELDVQLQAIAKLIDLLPEANKRLSPHVQASLLVDDAQRASAKEQVLAEAKHASAELDNIRSLLPR
jgi:hypothetical protein